MADIAINPAEAPVVETEDTQIIGIIAEINIEITSPKITVLHEGDYIDIPLTKDALIELKQYEIGAPIDISIDDTTKKMVEIRMEQPTIAYEEIIIVDYESPEEISITPVIVNILKPKIVANFIEVNTSVTPPLLVVSYKGEEIYLPISAKLLGKILLLKPGAPIKLTIDVKSGRVKKLEIAKVKGWKGKGKKKGLIKQEEKKEEKKEKKEKKKK